MKKGFKVGIFDTRMVYNHICYVILTMHRTATPLLKIVLSKVFVVFLLFEVVKNGTGPLGGNLNRYISCITVHIVK